MNTVTYQENSLGTMGIELEFELLCGEHIISVAEYKATIRIFWKTQNLPKLQAALDDTSLSRATGATWSLEQEAIVIESKNINCSSMNSLEGLKIKLNGMFQIFWEQTHLQYLRD